MCAIAEAESNVIRDRAQVVGQNIRSEDGIKNAIKLIELYAAEIHSSVDKVVQK